ncbi:MAG: glycosyltransferase family 9 protein [Myxococcota bacterium]
MVERRLQDGVATITVCPLGLGDVLFCTPALRLLREALPASEIGFVCQEGFRETLRGNPDVDRSHGMPSGRNDWRRRRKERALAKDLRPFGYGQAIVFYDHKGVPDWLEAAGVPRDRIFVSPGRTDIHRREKHYGFTQELLGLPRGGASGPLRIFPSDDDRREAMALLPEPLARGERPYVVAHIGNSTFRRRRFANRGGRIAHRAWPLENWEPCLPLLVEELGVDLVLTGSPKEGEIAQELLASVAAATRARIHVVAGRTPPIRLAALLEPAAAFIGADTGPTHFAAAVGTPVVGLYGPTDVVETVPLCPDPKDLIVLRTGIACSPCDRSVRKKCFDNVCLREIGPERVVAAVGELLGRRGAGVA